MTETEKANYIVDEYGTYSLNDVYAITPHTLDYNPKTPHTKRIVGALHHRGSAGAVITNTDYVTLRKMVFGE